MGVWCTGNLLGGAGERGSGSDGKRWQDVGGGEKARPSAGESVRGEMRSSSLDREDREKWKVGGDNRGQTWKTEGRRV